MPTFFDRNKKKSALAALLLFIRTRKIVTTLLVLVALASFLFVSPSNVVLSFPGGARVAAGVVWIAGTVGMDTAKWGLTNHKRDYSDLLTAFRAAKDGSGRAGWSSFMRGGQGSDAGNIGGGSLDFVKGSRKDLNAAGGGGANLPKPGSVAGVLNPDDAKNRGEGAAVALNNADLKGERAGLVKSAFAGGFAGEGSAAGAVGGGVGGGAYASKGFFSGGESAASGRLGDKVLGGVGGLNPARTSSGVQIKGAAKGQLSASKAAAIDARMSQGMSSANLIGGQRAYVQLAAGNGRASLSVAPNCKAEAGCPGEFAATNTGAIYDGNAIIGANTSILTMHDEPAPAVPLDADIPAAANPDQLIQCTDSVQQCETAKQPYYEHLGTVQTQLNDLLGQMPDVCGDPCNCGPCTQLENKIKDLCSGDLTNTITAIGETCVVPPYCAALGVAESPSQGIDSTAKHCNFSFGKCGPGGLLGKLMCML